MKTAIALALAILGSTTLCSAQQVGIGLSLKQNESSLYLPIRIPGSWLIEPYAHYSSRHQSITGDSSGTTGYPYNASYREWAFGVGLFWQKQMPERTSVYLGPRIGYVSEKNDINAYSVISSNDTHGFEVIPTLGFEFFPVKHLSLGGEVGYRFIQVRSSTSFVPYTPGYGPSDIRSQETVSTFLVRYSF